MAMDRNVRATVGVGLMAVGIPTAAIVWQVDRTNYGRNPVFWLCILVTGIGVGILLSLLFEPGVTVGPPSSWTVWRRQRRYRATSDQVEGRWTEELTLDRHGISGSAAVRCEVRTQGGETLTRELQESSASVVLRFPTAFVEDGPVRPPALPDGYYEVTWTIKEQARPWPVKRTLYSRFEVEDRPRWERVHYEDLPADFGSVRLRWDGATPFGLRCTARHLDTGAVYKMTKAKGGGFDVEGGVAVLFPDAFSGPVPPRPGRYEATWSTPSSGYVGDDEDPPTDALIIHEFDFAGAWYSVVNAIVQNEDRMFVLNLKLYSPDGRPSDEPVSTELTLPAQMDPLEPVKAPWNDYNVSDGDVPHYSLFYPSNDFGRMVGDQVENGGYTLRWRKRHGIGWRYVDKPHHFEIRDGMLVTDE
jgi:hypothetical protein